MSWQGVAGTEKFKFIKFLSSRLSVTLILILIQAAWIALMFLKLVGYSGYISDAFRLLSVVMALYIITKADVPAYRMGWILVIMIFPLFGGLLYLLLGEKRPARYMRLRLAKGMKNHDATLVQSVEVEQELKEHSPRVAGLSSYITKYARFPVWRNTSVTYHPLGENQYADMLIELQKAKKFIFLEYFIIDKGEMWDSILDILSKKAEEGVDVRIIYDDMGCLRKIPSNYYKKLEKLGIKCLVFNPFIPIISLVMNNRDHRKIMVIDGNTVFTGGINLADEYINHRIRFGHWKDTGVMLKGDAVWNFTVMFLEIWNSYNPVDEDFALFKPSQEHEADFFSDGFVQPFSDSPLDGETVSVNVYLDILAQAKDYVYIFTPYLAISDELQIALCAAAKRGVDVRMVLPGTPDKKIAYRLSRSYYLPLMEAGIRIYEYTPGFIHAKSYVSDDELAVVGTINMDYRSLYLHFECGVVMFESSAIEELKKDALKTFEVSHEVTIKERRRGMMSRLYGGLIDSILRVFAPLF
ncbi:MAG: cardiolipin synthase [Oscillospiraceae bacterium]|nr:cardiolipin synthase [Oscillospiraceae bacterium]